MRDVGRTRVGVIEDHPLYRAAVSRVLADAPDVELDAVAESVPQFAARTSGPGGVVLLDLRLRGVSDTAAVMEVVALGHRVLVLSAHASQSEVLGAVAAGARGYLSKEADGTEILRAVREIARGNSYVSPMLASVVLNASRGACGPTAELSARERQVLALLAAGDRDQDIARAMAISVRTVRSYLDRIRDKTGRRRRPELTRFAIEEGLLHEARTA
ncbi:two component transcriptional regulator, LuxR family [Streptoalloteichus tenebrarius]|uniref:Two component transcriptional regulator, LuxR family n=1 Tax=Streptoalloteichus tenebrarius (strain ATCC 17920 / DSM 40477 / JCM 4838 / CBS 697.72 / NBRC 16177 / NCIMB 11028 / NRRL B-12390 / A12253. 1 / ISP 5477) TaxID=1933 RepID=A0ABT1HUZ3_STRSD|nr:response regulator transcription factor [Streptoalloteichus tenebrarius]MCP2259313.1 two component transcriptional regulator, LuxR family [Streptoalloteichus tenebrarius]BFE99076.1 response regulator transcription factor [Streptoalloteichus tenebrarius]